MEFLELAKARYSCRKLSDRAVEPEKVARILDAAIAAPTAKNVQPYKIWKVTSPAALEKIQQVAKFPFVQQSKVVLVVGTKAEGAFVRPFDNKNYAEIDGAIVATHIILAVQAEGLGTTWVGYFDAPKLQELIPEMAGYELIALFPLGYPADDAKPAPRHFERRAVAEAVAEL